MSGGQELVAEMLRRGYHIEREGSPHLTHFAKRYLSDQHHEEVTVRLSFRPAVGPKGRPTFAEMMVTRRSIVPADHIIPGPASVLNALREVSREADSDAAFAIQWVTNAFARPLPVRVACAGCNTSLSEYYPGADGEKRCKPCHESVLNPNGHHPRP